MCSPAIVFIMLKISHVFSRYRSIAGRHIKNRLTFFSVSRIFCNTNIPICLKSTKIYEKVAKNCSRLSMCTTGIEKKSYMCHLGLGISDKIIIPRKTELTEQTVISDGIPAVPRNRNSRNSVPNPSAEEKTTRNSVPWIKNRSMLTESVPNPSAEEKITRNSIQ